MDERHPLMELLANTLLPSSDQGSIVFFGVVGICLTVIVIGVSWFSSRIYDKVVMSRRIQKISGEHVDVEPVQTSLANSTQRVEAVIGRVLPSLNDTSRRFRHAGLKVSIRVYVLIVLFFAGVLSVLLQIPSVPSYGEPLVWLVGLHAIFDSVVLRILVNRRQQKLLAQLPPAIEYIVRSISAGYSLEVSIQKAAEETEQPLGKHLATIPRLVRIGVPMPEALLAVAEEMRLPEFDFFVAACNAQLETGGNLAGVLQNLSDTIRARFQLQLKIQAMAAEGKFSGGLLALFPFGLLAYFTWKSPSYVDPLYSTDVGNKILIGSVVLVAVAILVIRQIVRIRV
jgi:tight adherence protein B